MLTHVLLRACPKNDRVSWVKCYIITLIHSKAHYPNLQHF